MKIIVPTLFLTCAALLTTMSARTFAYPPSQAQSQQQRKTDDSAYHQLVEQVKGGNLDIDFVKLRDAFAAWSDDPKNNTDAPNRDAMVEAFKKQDYAKAVELAEIVLDYEFINRGLHLATEEAYRKLGNESKAKFHHDIAEKLLKALLGTGDGKSMKTAYRVLSINEEYLIMRELGYEVHSQALLTDESGSYDLLSGNDKKTGKKVEVYFFLQGGL